MAFKATTYQPYDFANRRHIGPSPREMDAMLHQLGVLDLETLLGQTVLQASGRPSRWTSASPCPSRLPRPHARDRAENSVMTR